MVGSNAVERVPQRHQVQNLQYLSDYLQLNWSRQTLRGRFDLLDNRPLISAKSVRAFLCITAFCFGEKVAKLGLVCGLK